LAKNLGVPAQTFANFPKSEVYISKGPVPPPLPTDPAPDLELLIVLNNGTYESISLSAWLAANPHLLLATNFKVPESTFANFPTRERFMPG
jgi:oxalate decarboxylase/phosphoglucose isomerase-like protein (cupin superfamily)